MFKRLSAEMSPFFIGPMPAQEFLDTFLPPSKPCCHEFVCNLEPKPGMFSGLTALSAESALSAKFVCFRTPLFPEINPDSSRFKSLHHSSQA